MNSSIPTAPFIYQIYSQIFTRGTMGMLRVGKENGDTSIAAQGKTKTRKTLLLEPED